MTAVILQSRLDSSRLPAKALLPLGEMPVIARVMQRLVKIKADRYILACTADSFDQFAPLARMQNFDIFAGDKTDVLARYCAAIRHFNIAEDARIIRATGDNPFVFFDAAEAINNEAFNNGADYAGYNGLPYGAGVESVAVAALFRAEKEAAAQPEREHVCPYLYNHPEIFKLHRPSAPQKWFFPNIRLTVDTAEDYKNAKILFNALQSQNEATGETIIRVYNDTFKNTDISYDYPR
jgi:spore coat polysaccharide biosynthesis protein SpsF